MEQAVERLAALESKALQEAANKALVARWLEELWNQADFRFVREILSEDFQRHSAEQPASGPEPYLAIIQACHDGFPDSKITLADEPLADGDRVFVRWHWAGTHQAVFGGVPASGKRIDVIGQDVIRIRDGRITDIWPLFDPLRLMLQIGAIVPK